MLRILLIALLIPCAAFAKKDVPHAIPLGPVTFEEDVIRLRTFLPGIDSADLLTENYATVDPKVRTEKFNDSIETFATTFSGIQTKRAQNGEISYSIRFMIEHRADQKVIGTFVIHEYQSNEFEIGYWLSESYRRQGLVSRAVQLAITKIRALRHDATIIAWTLPDNWPSRNLLMKNGFEFEYEDKRNYCLHMLEPN